MLRVVDLPPEITDSSLLKMEEGALDSTVE